MHLDPISNAVNRPITLFAAFFIVSIPLALFFDSFLLGAGTAFYLICAALFIVNTRRRATPRAAVAFGWLTLIMSIGYAVWAYLFLLYDFITLGRGTQEDARTSGLLFMGFIGTMVSIYTFTALRDQQSEVKT